MGTEQKLTPAEELREHLEDVGTLAEVFSGMAGVALVGYGIETAVPALSMVMGSLVARSIEEHRGKLHLSMTEDEVDKLAGEVHTALCETYLAYIRQAGMPVNDGPAAP